MAELTIDERLAAAGVEVPADTSAEIKELLLAQAEKNAELVAAQEKIAEDAASEIAKARAAITEAKATKAPENYGTFTLNKANYEITRAKVQIQRELGGFEIVTAEELSEDKELQKLFVEKGYSMVQKKGK